MRCREREASANGHLEEIGCLLVEANGALDFQRRRAERAERVLAVLGLCLRQMPAPVGGQIPDSGGGASTHTTIRAPEGASKED
jgi:hypothetical protein